jgi:hypothetical protein
MTEKQTITEESGIHNEWYEEAKKVTLETLPAFVTKLCNDYSHDYGTICHAMAAAMTAAMNAVDSSPTGGITGFQAGCVMWMVLKHAFHKDGPMSLVDWTNLLYPQYADRFTTIPKQSWERVREIAQKKLSEDDKRYWSLGVLSHMQSIAEHGIPPFGLKVAAN